MILFLYGSDTYRSRQKLKEIVCHYQKTHKTGLNLKYFDLKEKNFQDFKDSLAPMPMFAEKKLFILFEAFSNPGFKQAFLKWAKEKGEKDNIVVFYEAGSPPSNDLLFKFLKEQGKTQEFALLSGLKLKNWLKKEISKYQAAISPAAVDKLVEFVGDDLWQMNQEIKKIAAYTKDIGEEDIKLLVKAKIDTDIFKTIDAIAQKDKKTALALLRQHLDKGDNPLYVLSMINFQFRNLLSIKDLIERGNPWQTIFQQAKLHPFVIKKCLKQAERFTLDELKRIHHRIFQTDLDAKTGRIEPETALDLLITGI